MKHVVTLALLTPCLWFADAARAQTTNIFHDPTVTTTFSGTRSGASGFIQGTAADTIDGPALGTKWIGYAENSGTGGSANVDLVWQALFPDVRSIGVFKISTYMFSSETGTTDRLRQGSIRAYFQDPTTMAWNEIPALTRSYGPNGGDGQTDMRLEGTFNLGIAAARGFRLVEAASAFANNGRTNGSSNAYIELENVEAYATPLETTDTNAVPEGDGWLMLCGGVLPLLAVLQRRRKACAPV